MADSRNRLRPRWTSRAALLGMLLGVALLAACGAPAPQPLRLGEAPWQPGETSRYSVSESGEMVGTAVLTVDEQPVNGAPGWVLRREVITPAAGELATVAFSANGFRPAQSSLALSDPDGSERVGATYSGGEVSLELTTRASNTTYQRYSVPSDTRDQRSLALILRSLPLAPRYATQLNSFVPLSGRLERVTVVVSAAEEVTTPAGVYQAWPVELDNGERTARLWYGVDAPYPLLRMEDGNITWELTQFQPTGP